MGQALCLGPARWTHWARLVVGAFAGPLQGGSMSAVQECWGGAFLQHWRAPPAKAMHGLCRGIPFDGRAGSGLRFEHWRACVHLLARGVEKGSGPACTAGCHVKEGREGGWVLLHGRCLW